MDTAVGILIGRLLVAVALFLIAVIIMRGVFRINKIVRLLTSIDSRLEILGSSSRTPQTISVSYPHAAPDTKEPSAPGLYGIIFSDISVGEKFEDEKGRSIEVIDFVQDGLKIRDAAGSIETLKPRNPEMPKTRWIFGIRSI
jgi:pilus assembly protein TadC